MAFVRNYRFETLSDSNNSDSSELVDDDFNDPDFDPSQTGPRPRPFLNLPNPAAGRLIFTSSDDDEEPSEFGPVNIPKSRKRTRNPDQHKQNIAKNARNSGQRYVTKKGKIIEEKTFQDVPCSCKMKCNDKITQIQRKALFDAFWKMGNFKRQNTFICGLVQKSAVKQRRPRKEEGSRERKSSNKYFVKPENNLSVMVCKKYFLNTFILTEGRVARALKKTSDGRSPGDDLRGVNGCPSRKVSQEDKNYVMQHIQSFPSYESHYTRMHNPNRKYLRESLCLRKMYTLYVEKCSEEQKQPVKEHYYRYVFNTKFNLHFYIPKKDTCKWCDIYKIKISNPDLSQADKDNLDRDHELHLRKAELARECMKIDGEGAKNNQEIYTCSIDLQKALPFPVLTVSDAYYKRNLYCYNFGVHDLATDSGFFYVWNEITGGRGSQEISSCVIKHLKAQASNKKKVTIFSDSCGGQNRNINMCLALMRFIQSDDVGIKVIDQKFLVSGHSFLPNDSDFGSVELAAKGKTIYVPEDWYHIMTSCRNKKKFMVSEMSNEEFFSTGNLERNMCKRKKNTETHPVNWLKMQWIRLEKDRPYEIQYKETLNDMLEFDVLNIKPTGRKGRPTALKNVPQVKLYQTSRPVGELKKQDMIDLLPFIPPIHHNFFLNLNIAEPENVEEDVGPLPAHLEENNEGSDVESDIG